MQIKWNWGTKLVLAMAAFMIMVIALVVVMFQQDVSLVEADYYPRGQAYQEMIQKTQNTIPYATDITASYENGIILISFPDFFKPDDVDGTVHFYKRTSDTGDRYAMLTLDQNNAFTYKAVGLKGRYIIKIDWVQDGVGYYTEKNLTIE